MVELILIVVAVAGGFLLITDLLYHLTDWPKFCEECEVEVLGERVHHGEIGAAMLALSLLLLFYL